MTEFLEAFFYWLKSKGIQLPTYVGLTLVAIVLFLNYLSMRQSPSPPKPSLSELRESILETPMQPEPPTLHDDKSQSKEPAPRPVNTQDAGHEEHQQEQQQAPTNFPRLTQILEDDFRTEGMDPGVAQKVVETIRFHFKTKGSLYDMRQSIQDALGPTSSESQVAQVQDMVLNAAIRSFDEMQARGEVSVDQNAPHLGLSLNH